MGAQRPSIVGPDAGPEPPYPYKMEGKVISGFGRGSKELGVPTANLPVDSSLAPWIASIPSGVYFGHASLALPDGHPQKQDSETGSFAAFPMVMSIGYNPFYKNTVRSAEVHVLHAFTADFYDAHMRLLILGFIREEKDYKSLEALVEDIEFDCRVARDSLAREAWRADAVEVRGEDGVHNGAEWLLKKL
ncbi:riboflavin kinase [Epichloe festucae Fl1]|uniref:Riboflavin kinase n=1 Tax=Epichloe festucae (strain Fl1) TaxID=877507 RepID=A0A7S9KLD6_EPIFF|nr:riboflavin kinase [Epichloe festucae Fl1]